VKFGDPDGFKPARALQLAIPAWLLLEEFRTKLIMILFFCGVLSLLALKAWLNQVGKVEESGVSSETKKSMKEYLIAILEDNPEN